MARLAFSRHGSSFRGLSDTSPDMDLFKFYLLDDLILANNVGTQLCIERSKDL